MRPPTLLLGVLTAVSVFTGCTSSVVVRNELAYPITVWAAESGNPPLSQLPLGSGFSLSSDCPSEGSLNAAAGRGDRYSTVTLAPGQSGSVTGGGNLNDPSGRKSINLLIAPVQGTTTQQAAWSNCAVSMPPPIAPNSVTVVVRRRTDGSGVLTAEAVDPLGNPVDQVYVGWNVLGAPSVPGTVERH